MKKWFLEGALVLAISSPATCPAQLGHSAAQAQYMGPAASAAKPSPAMVAKAKVPFQARASTISMVSKQALTPQQLGRFAVAQQALVRTSVDHLERANGAFQAHATAMRPKQRLLAELQVDLATNALRTAALTKAPSTPEAQLLLDNSIRLSTGANTAAQAIQRLAHDVEIFVQPTGGTPAEAMDVYVLPIGVVEYPDSLRSGQIASALNELKFNNPTSPSRGDLEPGYIYAVWVGTRHATAGMAKLVLERKVKYHTIDTADMTGSFTITFEAGERVVAP